MSWRDPWGRHGVNLSNRYANERAKNRSLDSRRAALEVALAALIDDDECVLDHHGYCQTHGPGSIPCAVATARALLGEEMP